MRTLHVVASLDPKYGGPPMIAARLAAGQAGLGHDVQMITIDDPSRTEAVNTALAGIPHFDRVRVHRLPPLTRMEALFGFGAKRELKRLIPTVDVVHIHSVWETLLRVAASVCRSRNTPYFVLLNGMLDPWSLVQSAMKKGIALALAYRRMLNGAAALHLGNADEQELIRPLNLRVPGVIIPNGVFLDEIDPLPPRGGFYAAHPELGSRPFVLFLSRLHYKKGLDYLAEAFIQLSQRDTDVQLVVAGPDGGAQAEFEQRIAAAGVKGRVHLVGPLYGRAKFEALVDAVCFCLPSRQEGFSVAITEAAACGVPVVISEGCHFPEIAHAGAGYVLPLEAARFADALHELVRDASLRERMSKAGRELIASRYTWPAIAQQTIDAYEAALKRSAAKR